MLPRPKNLTTSVSPKVNECPYRRWHKLLGLYPLLIAGSATAYRSKHRVPGKLRSGMPFANRMITMIRFVFLAIMIYTTAGTAVAQVISISKFYHDGKEMEMYAHGVPYFSFHEFDTVLTDTAREYLAAFGKCYKENYLPGRMYIIDLTAGMSEAEQAADPNLGLRRAEIIINYLNNHYGIGDRNFRIRSHETVHTNCVAFGINERHPKRIARRERRKYGHTEKTLNEDAYFKE